MLADKYVGILRPTRDGTSRRQQTRAPGRRARPTHDGKLNTSLAAGDGEETSMVSCSEQDGFDDKGVGEGGRHGSAGSCCAIAYDSSGASRQPGISTTHRTTTDDRQ